MAKNYRVRVYCETEEEWKFDDQTDLTLDPDFVPSGCEGHTLRDFTIDDEEEV